jgi:redox-regulated HSP33 family molecular chaperone
MVSSLVIDHQMRQSMVGLAENDGATHSRDARHPRVNRLLGERVALQALIYSNMKKTHGGGAGGAAATSPDPS